MGEIRAFAPYEPQRKTARSAYVKALLCYFATNLNLALHRAPISVVLPFYHGDKAAYLHEALLSIERQSLRATEVLLVQDGQVGKELEDLVKEWLERMPELRLVVRAENGGLSAALNTGIEAAQMEWLARMDADDICCADRFEKQWKVIEKQPDLAILGSWIEEYDEPMETAIAIRKLPADHKSIYAYARWRCPFNHMTVMYRKSVLSKIGLYKNYGAVGDDYELWARFLVHGYRSANLPEVLVKARTGEGFFGQRRRGWKYLRHEIREINDLYRIGLLKPWHYLFHFTVKAIVRLSPPVLVRFFYQLIRKTS